LSAKGEAALEAATDDLARHLSRHVDQRLADVAWTLQTGRRHWTNRRVLVARDQAEAAASLASRDPQKLLAGAVGAKAASLVFMFPGGGAQYPGMAAGLIDAQPVFKAAIEECAALMTDTSRRALRTFLTPRADKEPVAELERTSVALPALFAVE